jgi:hypothetical protein
MAGDAHNPALLTIEPTTAATYSDVTLRDLFAAAALRGLLSKQGACGDQIADEVAQEPDKAAECAYEFADAMLRERAKGGRTDGR